MEIRYASSSMEFLLLDEVKFLEVKDKYDDLFQWELVDVLDAHEEHDDDADSVPVPNGFVSWGYSISWSISSSNNAPIHYHPHAPDVEDHDLLDNVYHDTNRHRHFADDDDVDYECHGFQCEDDDDGDDGYELNDELVPCNVSNKLGRQRENEEIGEKGIFQNAQFQEVPLSVCDAWLCPREARSGS